MLNPKYGEKAGYEGDFGSMPSIHMLEGDNVMS